MSIINCVIIEVYSCVYVCTADVYAFGIILWEIMTRLEPYEDKEAMQIVIEVVNKGLRPTLFPEFESCPLVPLMKDCWNQDPAKRPIFKVWYFEEGGMVL